ncbi:MAG: ABC-F family ATP-binding cassette domain-containing protein [Thermodesulfobacteriota bacterium]
MKEKNGSLVIIEVKEIDKSYGDKVLFEGASFRIGARDRIGLVGPNGSGKTTIFRLLSGEEHPDRGEIIIRRGVHVGYLPQESRPGEGKKLLEEVQHSARDIVNLAEKMRILEEEIAEEKDAQVLEELVKAYGQIENDYAQRGGYSSAAQAKRILLGLGFRESDFSRGTDEFSGGWYMRILLAKILLANPDLLLLDEPTNHLDLEALIWLENFLADYAGGLVVVSHDRSFLNRVVKKIIAIEGKKIIPYSGNYDAYERAREKIKRIQQAAWENQRQKIAAVERFIDRFRYNAARARQVQSRIKWLEKQPQVDLVQDPQIIHFSFPQPVPSGKVVVELKDVHKAYGAVKVYAGLNLILLKGDKVAFVGPNGAGKSTLLKILAGILKPDAGTVNWGHRVSIGYFAQHQLELLDPTKTIWEEIFSWAQNESLTFLRGLLGAFLFTGDEINKKISVLSGGEKSRVVLAKMLMRPANFLLLDEPTNHLDINARTVLEKALSAYQGTLCLITHDRHLINKVANKIIEIQEGRINLYSGNYDDFIYKKELAKAEIKINATPWGASSRPAPLEQPSRRSREQKRIEAEARNRLYRETLAVKKEMAEVERLLEEATQEMEALASQLADPQIYRRGQNIGQLLKEHLKAKKKVEFYTAEWEKLAQQLEEIEEERKINKLGI